MGMQYIRWNRVWFDVCEDWPERNEGEEIFAESLVVCEKRGEWRAIKSCIWNEDDGKLHIELSGQIDLSAFDKDPKGDCNE